MVAGSVSHWSTSLAVTFDWSLETFTFRDSCYIYDFAFCENINFDFLTYLVSVEVCIAEFASEALRSSVCFFSVSFFRLVSELLAKIFETKLDCFVTVVFDSFLLKNNVRYCFNNCYRDKFTVLSKYLSHTNFSS